MHGQKNIKLQVKFVVNCSVPMLKMSSMIMDCRTFSTVAARLIAAGQESLGEYTKDFKCPHR